MILGSLVMRIASSMRNGVEIPCTIEDHTSAFIGFHRQRPFCCAKLCVANVARDRAPFGETNNPARIVKLHSFPLPRSSYSFAQINGRLLQVSISCAHVIRVCARTVRGTETGGKVKGFGWGKYLLPTAVLGPFRPKPQRLA